jgi:acetyl-CoA/propionyl-CoA carboxylase biotin carboxyl carrier protein
MTVSSAYDPMLAKVIAHGPDRQTALRRLEGALAGMAVLGVTTNISFLRALLSHPDVAAGQLDTGLAERAVPLFTGAGVPGDVLTAAALAHLLRREPADRLHSPWDIPDGWRVGEPAWTTVRLSNGAGDPVPVRIRGRACAGAEVSVGGADPVAAHAESGVGTLTVTSDGRTQRYTYAHTAVTGHGTTWLARDGNTWAIEEEEPIAAGPAATGGGDGVVRSPMPGTVLVVKAALGDRVKAGQPLLIVEAMKMEHTVSAPVDGVVAELTAAPGQQVGLDEVLAAISLPQEAG